jgi:phosphoribosyl 1,2-cyclic phosphodiesterase
LRLLFLGTGASGGTPGSGRSERRESSLLVQDGGSVLLDVTRDFARQSHAIDELGGVLLTHAHRDACGGIPQLRPWLRESSAGAVDVFASSETIAALRYRYARLDHCRFNCVTDGERHRVGRFTVSARTVPHAIDPNQPTFAWKLRAGGIAVVYASDVASLTGALRHFCRGADLLVIDAALWRRRLFSHLRIDEALPELCRWPVKRIFLTHIGRSAPGHERLAEEVTALCRRAQPAFDGMTVALA